jgi:hypothetical protein
MDWLTPRLHGAIDYALGAALIALPFAFEIDPGDIADLLLIGFGVAMIAFTALTRHDLALIRRVPLVSHLCIDLGAGALLFFSPWIFGFNERVLLPYLGFGFAIIWVAFLTGASAARAERPS